MDALLTLAPGPWGVVVATPSYVDVYVSKGGGVRSDALD
jgi:hypothetical protein